jgi:hypothetical protein
LDSLDYDDIISISSKMFGMMWTRFCDRACSDFLF